MMLFVLVRLLMEVVALMIQMPTLDLVVLLAKTMVEPVAPVVLILELMPGEAILALAFRLLGFVEEVALLVLEEPVVMLAEAILQFVQVSLLALVQTVAAAVLIVQFVQLSVLVSPVLVVQLAEAVLLLPLAQVLAVVALPVAVSSQLMAVRGVVLFPEQELMALTVAVLEAQFGTETLA